MGTIARNYAKARQSLIIFLPFVLARLAGADENCSPKHLWGAVTYPC